MCSVCVGQIIAGHIFHLVGPPRATVEFLAGYTLRLLLPLLAAVAVVAVAVAVAVAVSCGCTLQS